MADPKDKTTPEPAKEKPAPPTPPRAVSLDVTSSGGNGEYTFDIQVVSDHGRGFQSTIRIIEGENTRSTKQTDENGFLAHEAKPFEDEDRDFSFRVIGTNLEFRDTLDGPEQPEEKREKNKPIAGVGFWANIKNAVKNNKPKE